MMQDNEKKAIDRIMDSGCINTDKELWREKKGDYYSDSIHVNDQGGIVINCGGHVIVAPVRCWHEAGNYFLCVNPNLKRWKWKLTMWLLGKRYGKSG